MYSENDVGLRIAAYARQCVGKGRYKRGAHLERFFDEVDCTSLVVAIHKGLDINLPREIQNQLKMEASVSLNNIKPGDVIIMNGINGNGKRLHEAIYVGDDRIVHALPGKGITKETIDFCKARGVVAIKRFW